MRQTLTAHATLVAAAGAGSGTLAAAGGPTAGGTGGRVREMGAPRETVAGLGGAGCHAWSG